MWTLFITTLLHGRIIRDKTHISLYADTSLIWRMSIILWNMPSSASPKTTMKCTKQSPDPFMMSKDYNTQGEKSRISENISVLYEPPWTFFFYFIGDRQKYIYIYTFIPSVFLLGGWSFFCLTWHCNLWISTM